MAHATATSSRTLWKCEFCRRRRLRDGDGVINANTTTEAESIYWPRLLKLSVLGRNITSVRHVSRNND